MKIGIMDLAYTAALGFENGIRRIKELGYESIDFQEFANTDRPMFQCAESDFEKLMKQYGSFVKDTGLEISQTHGPWRWPPKDNTPEDRAERFEKMSRSIRGTAFLGCRNFVIHPIMPWGGHQDPEPEKFHAMNLEFMSKLCRVAEEYDVVICFENMPMPVLSLASPEACLRFAKEINSPNFKVCLDTGHCTMLNVKPADAVRMLGRDMLRCMHVHDNDGKNDLHWVPFTGVIDWIDFGKALQEIGFDGTLSLETKAPAKFTGENKVLQEKSLLLSAMQIAGRI